MQDETTKYLTCGETAKIAPGNPSTHCIWRWARRGVRSRTGVRVYLAHVRAGSKIFIPVGALETFMSELADADRGHFESQDGDGSASPVPAKNTSVRQNDIERAEADLDEAGI